MAVQVQHHNRTPYPAAGAHTKEQLEGGRQGEKWVNGCAAHHPKANALAASCDGDVMMGSHGHTTPQPTPIAAPRGADVMAFQMSWGRGRYRRCEKSVRYWLASIGVCFFDAVERLLRGTDTIDMAQCC